MIIFIGRRILYSAFALVGLIVIVFFLARLTGDPTLLYLQIDASLEARQRFAAQHGFDQPLIMQFWTFVQGLARFDLGESLYHGRPAIDLVLEAFPATLKLAALSMSLAIIVAIVTGSLAAWKPGGFFDRVASFLSLIGASVPNFWIAIVGILVFAVWLRLLPTSGTGTPAHWVMPIVVLMLRPCGILVQVVRGAMITALSSAYVKTAKAKGVSNRAIVFVHALRNAMLPVITVAGDQAAAIINGAVIVETVFAFPGIGRLLINSVTYRDFAVLQATVLIAALAIFLMNILIDLAYSALDPRIRHT